MPTIKEAWSRIELIPPEKRVELARQLKEVGYEDENVRIYTSTKFNRDNWERNIAERVKLVPGDAAEALYGIAEEPVDDAAVRGLMTFDRVHNLDHLWDVKLDDPIKARFK